MKNLILKGLIVSVLSLTVGIFQQIFAQDRFAIERAQQAVREKIIRDKGGEVTFPFYMRNETFRVSDSHTGVRGFGTWEGGFNQRIRDFSYEARVENRSGKVDRIKYKLLNQNDGGGRVPNWAIGTFYGRNPQTGGRIILTITENGKVNVNFDNSSFANGYFYNNQITIDGVFSRVTRLNRGIRTIRVDNGETIDYYRDEFGGGGSGSVPEWAVGTFYGRNPQTGGTITLTISSNGSVSANTGNGLVYGTIFGERLTIDGVSSKIIRLNNGIRTIRVDNGETIDYYRNFGGSNSVPNWAVGTFYARNPQTGGTIILNIEPNGNVTVNMDGAISYGTMYSTTLNINSTTSTVTKISGGIRTTRNDNGERINYRKQ